MIKAESYTEDWIKETAGKYKSDPILVEKVIYALTLLESITISELKFIFKGGTALMLLLREPKRFLIDIDIIITKKTDDLQSIFDKIIEDSVFTKVEKDERKSKSTIDKEHYKFYYKTKTKSLGPEQYILLDILYEDSHYGENIIELEIISPFTSSEKDNPKVTVPKPESILGDKMTAFAPKTTGIPYKIGKEVEIIKQLFDVGNLFDTVEDIEVVGSVFNLFAKTELEYRGKKDLEPKDVLEDIFQTAMAISTRGKSGDGDFDELQKGIKNIKNYIFSENFHIEAAMIPTAKAAYLSALLQTGTKDFDRFTKPDEIAEWIIEQPFESRLNRLKKTNPEAFYYWYKTYELLNKKASS